MGLLAISPNIEVVKSKVQDLQVSFFSKLQRNDILFVDSSHVLKTGSDLHFILFEVLPALNPGTLIHFHDIFFPFEYPKEHVLGDRWFSWNEAYALRAFLSYNSDYEIVVWNSCLEALENEFLLAAFPLYARGGSASIWLRKL